MAMRSDLQLGCASYGYSSRLCVEQCYVMKMQLNNLSGESSDKCWKNCAECADYREAVAVISKLDEVQMAEESLSIGYLAPFLNNSKHCA